MEWINFRHLFAFWAVCKHGGFRKASEKIFVSQSTVSEQVRELESYLGQTLLDRSTRGLHVTERGSALLGYADEIFSKSQEINRVFRDKNESLLPSTIRIGMVGGISRNFVFRLIADTLDQPDETQFELVDGSIDELTELLRSYELDLVFSLDRPRPKDLVSVTHRQVAASPLCIAGVPKLISQVRRRRKNPLGMELYLFRHPVAGSPLEDLLADTFKIAPSVPVRTDDISLLRFLANHGRGLALVPEMGVREDLDAGRVKALPVDGLPEIAVYAVFATQGIRRQRIEAFLPV